MYISSENSNKISSKINRDNVEKTTTIFATNSSSEMSMKNTVTEENMTCSSTTSTLEKKDEGFFKRLLHRNSKKVKKQFNEVDSSVEESKLKMSTEQLNDYHQKIEETRKEIRKEILSEAKSSLSAMLNTFILSPSSDHENDTENDRKQEYEYELLSKIHKPKSGPAARQRIIPKDLSNSPLSENKHITEKSPSVSLQGIQSEDLSHSKFRLKGSPDIVHESPVKYFKFPKEIIDSNFKTLQTSEANNETSSYKDTEISFDKQISCTGSGEISKSEHFEKREKSQPKIVGLSPFQQKVTRVESSTLDNHGIRPVFSKQRKSVEKSKSFRYYSENTDSQMENNLKKHENIPSLPDLSFTRKKIVDKPEFMPVSSSFEINDNNLLNQHRHQEEQLPLSQSIYTKNIILTTSKPSTAVKNITEIEENIDKLVKSPFEMVLRKPTSNADDISEIKINNNNSMNIVSTPSVRKTETEKEIKTEKSSVSSNGTDCYFGSSYKINAETKAVSTENLNKIEFRSKDRFSTSTDSIERKPTEKLDSVEFSTTIRNEIRNKDRKSMSVVSSSLNNITKSRRNSSVLEKFESNNQQIPEFMKIQLNRVDASRPKCNVVLAKNVKETVEDKGVSTFFLFFLFFCLV